MKVAAEAGRQKREGIDVVDFSAGEPDFPTPDNIKNAAIEALNQNFTKYTPISGTPELKQTIVDYHKRMYNTGYAPNECIVTVGGKHAIFNLTQALVDPGDEVVIPVPYWVTYADVVHYAAGKTVFAETSEEEGFVLTAAQLEKYLTPKTKMVILNSPSNPSGAVFDKDEMIKMYELCKSRGIWIMTDECYERFLYDSEPFSLAGQPDAKNTVVVAGSLSKTYAMTGWRIGFILAPPEVTSGVNKLQSHMTSNPTSISQKAAVEALSGPQDAVGVMLAEYTKRKEYVVSRLRKIPGVKCQDPRGAFYAYPNVSAAFTGDIKNSMDFASQLLAEEHVATVPGEAFGTSDHIRLSYATSMKELERGLDRIEKFIGARV